MQRSCHLRGLVYLASLFWIFSAATSIDITATEPVQNAKAIFVDSAALTLLWAHDGVQIMQGRFIR